MVPAVALTEACGNGKFLFEVDIQMLCNKPLNNACDTPASEHIGVALHAVIKPLSNTLN